MRARERFCRPASDGGEATREFGED